MVSRQYHLGKRAAKLEETRLKIVEAAVDLHCTVGPARTTVSQIADRAGVQRHTYYSHFPQERDLFLACSELALSRDPLPVAALWDHLSAGPERVEVGLTAFYEWYSRNAGQAACVLRDAEHHALTREIVELRFQPTITRAFRSLQEAIPWRATPLLDVAISFGCWQTLSRHHEPKSAATLMTEALFGI